MSTATFFPVLVPWTTENLREGKGEREEKEGEQTCFVVRREKLGGKGGKSGEREREEGRIKGEEIGTQKKRVREIWMVW